MLRPTFSVLSKFTGLRRMSMTLFDEVAPPGILNLRMGTPAQDQLSRCATLIQSAANARMVQENAATLFNFGPELGATDFRKALTDFLSNQYQNPVTLDSVMETAGATHGLHLLASVFFSPGDIVFTEHSTYFIALQILRDGLSMNPKSVCIDSEGIDVDALERSIEELGDIRSQWKPTPTRPYWALVYLVPNFQNPTGFCISPDRAKRLVEVARKYDLLVVCDDVYDLLYFPKSYPDGHPPLRLFGYDDDREMGHIVSNGSFSKIFGPGVRVGWLEAPNRVIKTVLLSGIPKGGGAFNHMSAGLLTNIMQDGELDKLLDQTRTINEEKCKAMVEIFLARAPKLQFSEPKGGYFLWLKLPEDFPYTAHEFSNICMKDSKLTFFPGEIYSAEPTDDDRRHMRVCYVPHSKEILTDAAIKISDKFNELYT